MSLALGSMESLTRVFGLLEISASDKQALKEQCGIDSVKKLMENRQNLASSSYKSCHLLVAGIGYINERRAKLKPPYDDTTVHLLFTSSESLDASWEHYLARLIEQAKVEPEEQLTGKRTRTEQGEMQKGLAGKTKNQKVFRNGDVYWEEVSDEGFRSTEKGIDVDELGINTEDSPWTFDDSGQYVVLANEPTALRIPKELFKMLYCYQRSGVAWMAGLHIGNTGGILGE